MPGTSSNSFRSGSQAQLGILSSKLQWRRSPGCGTHGSCVEIAALSGGGVAIRDGKLGEASSVLTFNQEEWDAFVAGVKAGEFG